MPDPLMPPASLVCQLGSLAVHIEEFLSSNGHELDKAAIDGILTNPEFREWMQEMGKQGYLPVKRNEGTSSL